MVDESHNLLDGVGIRDLVKDAVGRRRLHDLVAESGELTIGLVADDHSVFVHSLYFLAGQVLVAFIKAKLLFS